MNGLSRVAGIGPRVMLNGKEYQVRGKTNRFFAEVGAAIIQSRGDPFDMIVDAAIRSRKEDGGADRNLIDAVVDSVATRFRNWGIATYGDYIEFLASPEGDVLTVYHCLKQDAPEVTIDEVRHYMITMQFRKLGDEAAKKEIEDLMKAIEVASGEDWLGNSTSQIQETPNLAKTGS